uniref:Cadherin 19 n=1 Tax=Erpetoichthys calabaricus TaxID=27687 RepID=A0A8C4RX94_ERPCA
AYIDENIYKTVITFKMNYTRAQAVIMSMRNVQRHEHTMYMDTHESNTQIQLTVTNFTHEIAMPVCLQKCIESDYEKGNLSIKYILSGDGAGSDFKIDENTGKIYSIKRLDREKRAFYTMRAQAIDKKTMQPVEPESEFIIKVQDINDNKPVFQNEPYITSIPEMCAPGTSVIQVTATDADDPSFGNGAKIIYSILKEQPYFSVEPKTGIIFTLSPDMDREIKDQYLVIIQAKDMAGQSGGFSVTTTVTINLSDINDNSPKFREKMYRFFSPEDAPVGAIIGRIMADDSDTGENAEVNYTIKELDSFDTFDVINDHKTQEGIIVLKRPLDFESKSRFHLRAEAINRYTDPKLDSSQLTDVTDVKITVGDVDEPPVFMTDFYLLNITENAPPGSVVGTVAAKDQDEDDSPIRYSINHWTNTKRIFKIDIYNGSITAVKPLDREAAFWHNITVSATEAKKHGLVSKVSVIIRVIDVNDNAPEFPKQYTPFVCETAKPGQLIQTISAADKDDPVNGHHFYYMLESGVNKNPNFTLKDNQDNTAGILTRRSGFSRQDQAYFYLPILITDSGEPALSSTNTLTIMVCDCYPDGICKSSGVEAFALSVGLSPAAFIVLLTFTVFLLMALKLHKKMVRSKKWEDVTENVGRYDDEGGGEEDTNAFDVVTLRSHTARRERNSQKEKKAKIRMSIRQSLNIGPDDDVFREFILDRLYEADTDPCVPPYDCLHIYAFEGENSIAGSLSSLESLTSFSDKNKK